MAEFREVMKQWKRMCESSNSCQECPLYVKEAAGMEICTAGIVSFTADAAEKAIMTWAVEHPEPVYPTWGEWLHLTGLCEYENSADILEYHIPADIAKKLGIEPKEDA